MDNNKITVSLGEVNGAQVDAELHRQDVANRMAEHQETVRRNTANYAESPVTQGNKFQGAIVYMAVFGLIFSIIGWLFGEIVRDKLDNHPFLQAITWIQLGYEINPEITDAELRNRIQESYAINSTGSVESLKSNLAQLSGVIDVAVLENYTNSQITKYGVDIDPHSIAVCVSGGEDADIASIIYARKDIGCGTTGDTEVQYIDTAHANTVYRYNIIRPVSTNFYIYVDFFSTELNSDLQDEIKQALINDFLGVLDNDRVKLASEVFSSRFYQCIQNVTNAPIASLTIALGSGTASQHVTIDADVEPTLAASESSDRLG